MMSDEFNEISEIQNVTVLIIDSSVDSCLLMKAYLLRKGCEVYIRHSPESALQFLQGQIPDVILLNRYIGPDPDALMDEIKAFAPNARIITQKQASMEDLTKREKEIIRQFTSKDKFLTSDRLLALIIVLIVILFVLQIALSAQ